MRIQVVGHRVLVKPAVLEDIDEAFARAKKAGIELLENDEMRREKNAIDKGRVVSIGSTAFKDFGGDPWCAVGDYIAFAKHAGRYVEDPDTKDKYIILNDEDVICVFVEDK